MRPWHSRPHRGRFTDAAGTRAAAAAALRLSLVARRRLAVAATTLAVFATGVALALLAARGDGGSSDAHGSDGGGRPDADRSHLASPVEPGVDAARSATAGTLPKSGPSPAPPSDVRRPEPIQTMAGWTVTVYYTAVEELHSDGKKRVTGCRQLDCSHGHDDLGKYPESFVAAVRAEGTGRTAAGSYLNWSYDTGFWLDEAPRDTAGRLLRPFESAAADQNVLRQGTRFTIIGCGTGEGGDRIPADVCSRLRGASWTITDEFTPGVGGQRHVDVYIGEETGPNFTEDAWYTTLVGATLRTG